MIYESVRCVEAIRRIVNNSTRPITGETFALLQDIWGKEETELSAKYIRENKLVRKEGQRYVCS